MHIAGPAEALILEMRCASGLAMLWLILSSLDKKGLLKMISLLRHARTPSDSGGQGAGPQFRPERALPKLGIIELFGDVIGEFIA
jgi:hypothetical protein